MSASVRTATAADDPALSALWKRCFESPHLAALHALDPDRHRHTFVAQNDAGDGIDAVVVYVPRLIRDADGIPQRVGGIGSVATRPEARGQGLVRRLLVAAERTMTAEQCAWSLLFTGTPGVYRGSGWQEFASTYTEGTLVPSPADSSAAGAFRVRGATARDAVEVAALHHAYNAKRPLSSLRAPDDWAVRVPAWYGAIDRSLVAQHPVSGAIAGWMVAGHEGDCVQVREFAGSDECLGSLLAAVGSRGRAAGLTLARVRIPVTPGVRAALPGLLTDARQVTEHVGMARPLHATAESVRATVTAPGAVHWYGDCF
ncbi:GNAT family N-acetyltransferase [Streptomyces laculatispora]|uniref:GNAT family N-acetyltransferase n=1 Tax=Streptomyces laculatispora TaxID=887464 RepID=A0ABY9IBL8_9ACTN|nr:GNAT family N-acetyltransferase [Streptomyces laculatispora]WLQ44272.1 GNAT family N-acetyltransferase [Streptomyces laculatispora]